MFNVKRWGLAAVVLAAVTLTVGADEKIALDKLPEKVAAAAKAKFPKAKMVSAETEKVKDETHYEIAFEEGDKKFEAIFKADGDLVAVEKVIDVKDLPKVVTEALETKYPKASLKKAEEITKGKEVTYEMVIETADKKMLEVTFDAKGKFVEEEKIEEKKEEKKEKKEEKKDK